MKTTQVKWLKNPETHDYTAAASYLNLLFSDKETQGIIKKLKTAAILEFKAKDIFRASRLPLLSIDNFHVEKDRKAIKNSQKLSPILLVRDRDTKTVIIADGYHRMCAVYSFDEDAFIKCKIV